jgi:integrase
MAPDAATPDSFGRSLDFSHDLRRTCARLYRAAGGELEQIQFLLSHVSVQTTEPYLGCTQWIASAVNDKIGIEPAP